MVREGALVLVYRITARGRSFLLVKNARSKRWSFPAGGSEEGEDFKTAALRELEEETGLKKSDLIELKETALFNIFYNDACEQTKQKCFIALVSNEDAAIAGDDVTEVKWAEESQIPDALSELSLRQLFDKLKKAL